MTVYIKLALLLIYGIVGSFDIEECCCTSDTIDQANDSTLVKLLNKLKDTVFFRIYQVALEKECLHFEDNPMCAKETCTVQECCEEEIPEPFKDNLQSASIDDSVDLSWAFAQKEKWTNEDENQWVEAAQPTEMTYVDMSKNLDGYTGYKGKEAGKIWKAIYEANCFANIEDECKEERVFYKLISGFHTLTTALVFSNFPDDDGVWGPSLKFYRMLLHGKAKDEYVNNLYFGYVFLLRALNKAAPVLRNFKIDSGNPQEDFRAHKLLNELLSTDFIHSTCTPTFSFDETQLFQGERTKYRDDFRRAFRNISTVLDCVGCEKCKLHAKLEFHGLGTALKILFTNRQLSALEANFLERNEVIALILTISKYADAIEYIKNMKEKTAVAISQEDLEEKHRLFKVIGVGVGLLLALCVQSMMLRSTFKKPEGKME